MYLLDTNVCIALINGRPPETRRRFEVASVEGERIVTSSIVVFELWYGVAKSARIETNTDRMHAFLAGPIEVVEFDDRDGEFAGRIRAELESTGRPIGAYGLLIAGQARRHSARLVTSNRSEFARVAGLHCEAW